MFEVGKFYKLKLWADGEDGGIITEYGTAKVIEVEGSLIKLKDSAISGGDETILNTASIAFVSAVLAAP